MKRSVCAALGALLWIGAGTVAAAAPAPQRELVIANENLVGGEQYLSQNLDGFLRRVEEVAGWPKGSLRGKAFARPAEALDYIKKNRAAFAILPVHQLLEGHKPLKLEVLGRAVGLDGTKPAFTAVTRKPHAFGEWHETPGLRLATVEDPDPNWLTLLFEFRVQPAQHFKVLEVPTAKAALAAVLDKKADIALLWEGAWREVKARIEPGGDLDWVHTSPDLAPSAVVAVGKHARAADRKAMAAALDKICKTTGAPACGRMGILYVETRKDRYDELIQIYESIR